MIWLLVVFLTLGAGKAHAASMTVSPNPVVSGSTITVTVTKGPGSPTDWVGMASSGAPLDVYLTDNWKYLNNMTTPPTKGLTNATVTLVAPTAGNYVVRWYANNGVTLIVPEIPIVVTAVPPPPPLPAGGPTVLATDCAMTAGSAVLTCPTPRFAVDDPGKVVGVEDAGPEMNGYRLGISGTIVSVQSALQATLSVSATVSVNPSPRALWGVDKTAFYQAQIEALPESGGVITIPAGHHMVEVLKLPCAVKGANFYGPCPRAHNNITLRGAGRGQTILENWKVDTQHSILELGFHGEIPTILLGNDRVKNLIVRDLTLRQVKAPTNTAAKVVAAYATERVDILDNEFIGAAYECLVMSGGKSRLWSVRGNVATTACGFGGPGYSNTTSAFNLGGNDWIAEHNLCENAGQCFEISGYRIRVAHNYMRPSGPNALCVNVGSSGGGAWNIVIQGNHLENCDSGALNGIGTLHSVHFLDNYLYNATWAIGSGLDANTVVENEPDTLIHGHSVIAGNTAVATQERYGVFTVGGNDPIYGRERVLIHNNRIINQAPAPVEVLLLRNLQVPIYVSDMVLFGSVPTPPDSNRGIKFEDTARHLGVLKNIYTTYDAVIYDQLSGVRTLVPAGTIWSD